MKEFTALRFDADQCRAELADYQELLDSKADLEEQADIKPFFEAHPQLAALLGTSCGWGLPTCNLIAFQYQLFGDFGCDLVVGDSAKRSYAFIEWEDATPGCLFRQQGRKATPEWSGRLERGFSQIVDWFWKLEDMSRTDEFQVRFGNRHARWFGLLVIGRDAHLTHDRERNRWDWRGHNVLVNGRSVRLATYDQLYREWSMLLEHYFPPSTP